MLGELKPKGPKAEMGDNRSTVDLGDGRTATAVTHGYVHACALLVRMPIWRSGDRDLQAVLVGPTP